jgi:hypothetical protein
MPETNVLIAIAGGIIIAAVLFSLFSGGSSKGNSDGSRRQVASETAPSKKRTLVVAGPYTK